MAYTPRIVSININSYRDEVRERLGVDSGVVSDTTIDAPSVLPVAEARVISRVPDYLTLVDDDQSFLYAATIEMIASVLAPSMSSLLKASEGDSDYKYSNQNVDWHERSEQFESAAYDLIDYISTQPVVELPQVGVSGPTTNAQQTLVANGQTDAIAPEAADISLYPQNVE